MDDIPRPPVWVLKLMLYEYQLSQVGDGVPKRTLWLCLNQKKAMEEKMLTETMKTNITKLYEKFDVPFSMDVMEDLASDSYYNKENLIEHLRNIPTWDEETLRFYIDVECDTQINIGSVRCAYISLIYPTRWLDNELYNKLYNVVYMDMREDGKAGDIATYLNSLLELNVSVNKKLNKAFVDMSNKLRTMYNYDKYDIARMDSALADMGDAMKSKHIKERIYVSANPYDYLSMSYGNSWDSCHKPNGCYCVGALSYLLDEVSLVAYITHDDITKVFREMIFMSDYALFISRQYGSINMTMSDLFNEKLQDVHNNIYDIETTEIDKNNINDYFRTNYDGCHYQDYNYDYDMYLYVDDASYFENTKATIGHVGRCVSCGDEIYDSDDLNCHNCTNSMICAECDGQYDLDTMYYVDSIDAYVCEDCYNEYFAKCPHCGQVYRIADMIYIDSIDEYVCEWCTDEYYRECGVCEQLVHINSLTECTDNSTGEVFYICNGCKNW